MERRKQKSATGQDNKVGSILVQCRWLAARSSDDFQEGARTGDATRRRHLTLPFFLLFLLPSCLVEEQAEEGDGARGMNGEREVVGGRERSIY